jgi:hypothetical protein
MFLSLLISICYLIIILPYSWRRTVLNLIYVYENVPVFLLPLWNLIIRPSGIEDILLLGVNDTTLVNKSSRLSPLIEVISIFGRQINSPLNMI